MGDPLKIPVCSLKGGTGKTTICLSIARALRDRGERVGLLDVDIHASSLPRALKLQVDPGYDALLGGKLRPLTYDGFQLFSIGLLFREDTPNLWDGAMKASAVKQIATTAIAWDEDLSYVVVDTPPTCLVGDTHIYTPDGPRPLEELQPGDIVFGFEGGMERSQVDAHHYRWRLGGGLPPVKVRALVPQGTAEAYELRTNTRRIRATGTHPFPVLRRERLGPKTSRWSIIWTPLAEVKPGDHVLITHTLPQQQPTWPVTAWDGTTVDMSRLVGYFLGDGYVKRNSRYRKTPQGVLFAEPIGGKFRGSYIVALERLFGRKIYQNERQFGILSREVADQFIELGVARPALEKAVPPWVYRLPPEAKVAIIEGFCDADGHWRHRKDVKNNDCGNMCLITASPTLAEGLKDLAVYAGLRAGNLSAVNSVGILKGRQIKSSAYHVEVVKPKGRSPRNYMATSLCRARGRVGRNPGFSHPYLGFDVVRQVTPVGIQEVFDLQLEGPHAFVANGMVIHNSGDEVQSLLSNLTNIYGAVVVCQPNDLSVLGIEKTLNVLRSTSTPIAGIVANMVGYTCPQCGYVSNPFDREAADVAELARKFGVAYLGSVPFGGAVERAPHIRAIVDRLLKGKPVTLREEKGGMTRWLLEKLLK